MIKAIDTYYKGYKFRSRLEARWAVFFDSLDIKWEYEKEGFHLGQGINYLPDFWLPEVNMWAEVKPEEFNEIELLKARLLAKQSGNPVLKLIGIPDNKTYDAVKYSEDDNSYFVEDKEKLICSKCNSTMEILDNDINDMTEGQECEYLAGFRLIHCCNCGNQEYKKVISEEILLEKTFYYVDYCLSNYHNYPKSEGRFFCSPGCELDEFVEWFEDTAIAVNKARSKRFEFGE